MLLSVDMSDLVGYVGIYDEYGKRIPMIQMWDTEKNEGYAYIVDDMGNVMAAFDDPNKPLEVKLQCPNARVICFNKVLAEKYKLEYMEGEVKDSISE